MKKPEVDKFLLDRSIPAVGRKKTEHEKRIDLCIPDAVDNANELFRQWFRLNGKTTDKNMKQQTITRFFLDEMEKLAHDRGFRRSRKFLNEILWRKFNIFKKKKKRKRSLKKSFA